MKRAAYAAISLHTLISAVTFLVAKDATTHFTAFQLAWFRIETSGAIALIVLAFIRRWPKREDLPRLAFLALSGIVINQTLFLLGLSYTVPLHSALLYAFTPILVLLGAVIHLHEPVSWRKGIGVMAALAGVLLVLLAQGLDLSGGTLRGDIITLLAVFTWSTYTVGGKSLLRRYDALALTAWLFVLGALQILPAGILALKEFDVHAPGWQGWMEVAFLSTITSGLAFTLWYFALERLDASQVAIFSNLQAPLTALLAWLVLDAVPEPSAILGGILVLTGVLLVQFSDQRRRAART